MAETLYRKYRPQRFADVAEQDHVIRTLHNQLIAGTVAHAYLFAGPRGVGKTTIARLLAKAVNCEGRAAGEAEPCNACTACREFAEGRYMDTVEMDAASNTGVDNVRENVIENVRFVPQHGKYKVFIIDEVHMLSTSAFNALLKTLEEPPQHALFILATTELHKIPATIVSRCQRFDFHRILAPEMIARLQKLVAGEGATVDDAALAQIARLSEGCLRDAESLLGQVLAAGSTAVLPQTNAVLVREVTEHIDRKDLQPVVQLLATFVEEGGSVRHFTDELIEYVRDRFLVSLSRSDVRLLDLLLASRSRTSLSLLPQLPLEIALAEFLFDATAPTVPATPPPAPQPRATPPPGGLVGPRTETPKPTAAPAAATSTTATDKPVSFTAADLQDKWERCCAYVADRNVALPLVLQSARAKSIEGNTVTLACAFSFHADALEEIKNKRLVEEAIAAVMLEPVRLVLVVEPAKQDDAATALAAAFGGAVVG